MFPKPARGEFLMERRKKRQTRKVAEDSIMQAAKRRDKFTCRVPWCEYQHLPVDAAHEVHRGSGGNPKGDRTASTAQIVSLCRIHHGQYDAGTLTITPKTNQGFDGECAFGWEAQ